jgi:hypothetical protein
VNQETQRLLDVIAEDDLTAVADNAGAFAAELRRLSEENTRLRSVYEQLEGHKKSITFRYRGSDNTWIVNTEDHTVEAPTPMEAIILLEARMRGA